MKSNPALVESLLGFWADAGVETAYADAPIDRLAPHVPRVSARALEPGPQGASDPASDSRAIDGQVEARRLAASALDLEELGVAIAQFDGCALSSAGARQAVFFRGAPDAPVMIIGEAPGADEDIRGQPFVGKAGQLLDKMLGAAGLEGRVFITNTVFWRPPGNRTPSLIEQQACAPFLERAIELVRPRFLLLVGGAAAKSMLGTTGGILSLRGRWSEWRSTSGNLAVPAMPTLHPAFLLRQPAAKKKVWEDLLALAERLETEDVRPV